MTHLTIHGELSKVLRCNNLKFYHFKSSLTGKGNLGSYGIQAPESAESLALSVGD
jgi:hypothetical protein